MPAMPRINNKMKKIAYNILGFPVNMKKPSGNQKPLPSPQGIDGMTKDVDAIEDRGWTRQQWIPNISGTTKPKKYQR